MILILILCAIIVITSIFLYRRYMDGVFEKSSFSSGKLNDDPPGLSRGCRVKHEFKNNKVYKTLCKNTDQTKCDNIPVCEVCKGYGAYCGINSQSCCPDYKCHTDGPTGGKCG